ncbi:MAG: hypothetical protein ACRDTS_25240, partial [Mycobacterium sp.]
MSGQLVGEVLAASGAFRAAGLSERGFHALVAIAEKCHTQSRQGSVPWKRSFSAWLPQELTRSLVNTESLYALTATTGATNSISGGPVNATFNGLLNT